MPHPQDYDRDYARYPRTYSPPATVSTYSNDPYDRRAVQPYRHEHPHSHSHRDGRAMQPYAARNGHGHERPLVRRSSDSTLSPSTAKGSRTEQSTAWVKDHGAELIGAAAGGLAGRKSGARDDHLRTASGAAIGAIGGKVLGREYRKRKDRREDKKVGREVRRGYDSDSEDSYDSYNDLPPPRRYSRSVDRGRERDVSPQGWRDVGRRIRRSLSRRSLSRKRAVEDERR